MIFIIIAVMILVESALIIVVSKRVEARLQELINSIAGLMEHNERLMDRISTQEIELQGTVTELVGLKMDKDFREAVTAAEKKREKEENS